MIVCNNQVEKKRGQQRSLVLQAIQTIEIVLDMLLASEDIKQKQNDRNNRAGEPVWPSGKAVRR